MAMEVVGVSEACSARKEDNTLGELYICDAARCCGERRGGDAWCRSGGGSLVVELANRIWV